MTASKFVDFKTATPNPRLTNVKDISPDELLQNLKKVKIIDVRRPDEWVGEYGHIPEAELLTLDFLPMKIAELPKDQTIVFVCRSGARSANAAAFALENGFTSVYNMQGGMIEWTNKNYKSAERNGQSS